MFLLFTFFILLVTFVNSSSNRHHHQHQGNYCSPDSLFLGTWKYHQLTTVSTTSNNPFGSCQNTFSDVSGFPLLSDQIRKWTCWNQSYHLASFQQLSSCSFLPWKRSIQKLKDKKIAFVGDSLMAQLYISAQCMYESLGFPTERRNVRFFMNLMLRPDKPCYPECLRNPTATPFRCFSCPNGVRYEFNSSTPFYPHFWMSQIPEETFAIITGAGAWFSLVKFLDDTAEAVPVDPVELYFDKLAPFFHRFIHEKKMNVFWVNLPPLTHSDPSLIRLYGWNNFAFFDSYAKERLTREGVVFIDSNRAVAERKRKDANISDHPYGLHWCNPGRSTIPEFINQAIFHLLALSLDEEIE
jgi:hypothetical protein